MKIRKILIANRGEIAVRVINACRELGIKTVAVYSSADEEAVHTESADESYMIGQAPAAQSYLRQDMILSVARKAKCDAIHPGYGFLAENGEFADKVRESGLIFIGPPASAIRDMGEKTVARKIMQKAGVPVVPGTVDPVTDIEDARKTAAEIGYPVLIKAAGGGGGKGMRKVEKAKDFDDSFERAVSEATSSFGNPDVYIEKYLENPRHIEFQILADNHGNVVHLGERECTIQRRHQKVIEECPSPTLTEDERARFGEIAVTAAKACSYSNAGTVEFLMDKHRNFYFLEMNTRLQVEHPVTEYVTGIDIVYEQIRIASGEKLGYTQDNIKLKGHSIECRIYAEDPAEDFYPSTGTISYLRRPVGTGIRIDSGVVQDSEISVYYDPLVAKLICYGQDRNGVIRRSLSALDGYKVFGLKTNISFCHYVLNHPKFIKGDFDTNFIQDHFKPEQMNKFSKQEKMVIAAAAAVYRHNRKRPRNNKTAGNGEKPFSTWKLKGMQRSMR